MKHAFFSFLILFLLESLAAQCSKEPFALIELFSSEGCSSCPPDDSRFNTYYNETKGKNILMIDHHVDYWNGPLHGPCGVSAWPDPFSSSEVTETQREYEKALNGRHLVTPQFVVQGKYATSIDLRGFSEVRELVENLLKKQPSAGICLGNAEMNQEKNEMTFEYTLVDAKTDGNYFLVCILYENGLEVKITAGENCGKTLHHDAVRRVYKRVRVNSTNGRIKLEIPKDVVTGNAGVLAYIQDGNTLEVVGGTTGFDLK